MKFYLIKIIGACLIINLKIDVKNAINPYGRIAIRPYNPHRIPIADDLYNEHLIELQNEGLL